MEKISIPKDNFGRQRNYAFIVYIHSESVEYALKIFDGTCLFDRVLKLQFRGGPKVDRYDASKEIERDAYPRDRMRFNDETLKLSSFDVQNFAMSARNNDVFSDRPNVNNHLMPRKTSSINDLSFASLTGQWSSKNIPAERFEPYKRDSKYNRDKEMEYRNKYEDLNNHRPHRDRNNDRNYKRNYRENYKSQSRR